MTPHIQRRARARNEQLPGESKGVPTSQSLPPRTTMDHMHDAPALVQGRWWKGPFMGHLLPGLGFVLWGLAVAAAWVTPRPHPRPASKRAHKLHTDASPQASFSSVERLGRAATSVLAIATEMFSARLNTGGALHWLHFSSTGGSNMQNYYHATCHGLLLLALGVDVAHLRGYASARTAVVALGLALSMVAALIAAHAGLQGPSERAQHLPMAAALGLAAASTLGDAAWPHIPAWLGWRSYSLALTGAWMSRMAVARQHGWDAQFEADPMASSMAATLHFVWTAMALACAWGLLAVVRQAARRQGSSREQHAVEGLQP